MRPSVNVRLRVISLIVVALVGVPAAALAATPNGDESRSTFLLAEARHNGGRPTLRVCADLTDVARAWSGQMAKRGRLSHNPSTREQIGKWSRWAENVGSGGSVDSVHGALMTSSGHRANILSTKVSEVGVGVVRAGSRVWVTQVFRKPSGPACSAPLKAPASVEEPPVADVGVDRIQGADRYETAVALSRDAFSSAATVVVASGDRFPDALSAAPLAHRLSAPILLAGRSGMKGSVLREISRLGARRAVLVGSTGAVTTAAEQDLRSAGLRIERVAGHDRYTTSAKIAAKVGGGRAVLARGSGNGWADAMAAAGYAAHTGRAVLLTDRGGLDPSVALLVGDTFTDVDIVGGTAAVPSSVERDLVRRGAKVRRLAGDDRLATSAAVARASVAAGLSPDRVWLATSRNWSDALSAGPSVARSGGVLLLARPSGMSTSHANGRWLADQRDRVDALVLVGGKAAITDRVARDAVRILAN